MIGTGSGSGTRAGPATGAMGWECWACKCRLAVAGPLVECSMGVLGERVRSPRRVQAAVFTGHFGGTLRRHRGRFGPIGWLRGPWLAVVLWTGSQVSHHNTAQHNTAWERASRQAERGHSRMELIDASLRILQSPVQTTHKQGKETGEQGRRWTSCITVSSPKTSTVRSAVLD